MKLSLIILFLFSLPSANAGLLGSKVDPEWLVKINTTTPSGETISGTGYIVKIGDEFFVKTASHVTLGSEDVELYTGSRQPLVVREGEGIIDNRHDDQLIKIGDPGVKPLGIYSPNYDTFVIPRDSYEEWNENNRRIKIEMKYAGAGYITPKWLGRKDFESQQYEEKKNLNIGVITNFYKANTNQSNISYDMKTIFAQSQVLPGESGSPLVKEIWARWDILDLNGNTIEAKVLSKGSVVPVIQGHVEGYSRFLNESRFVSALSTKEMIESLIGGKTGSMDETYWVFKNGVFYRRLDTKSGPIIEANIGIENAGNGTGGNGGNGTGGNGGNGTGGNGGNGSGFIQPKSGMIYHGIEVEAFHYRDNERDITVYGDWNNLRFLEDLRKSNPEGVIEAIPRKEIGGLIYQKLEARSIGGRNSLTQGENSFCQIDSALDSKGKITVNLKGYGYKAIEFDVRSPNFFPIQKIVNTNSGETFWVDIRGLYSVDISSVSKNKKENPFLDNTYKSNRTEIEYFSETPYIIIGNDQFMDHKIDCDGELSYYTLKKLVHEGDDFAKKHAHYLLDIDQNPN